MAAPLGTLALAERALEDSQQGAYPLSRLLEQAIRIASQMDDHETRAAFELELVDGTDRQARKLIRARLQAQADGDFSVDRRIVDQYTTGREASYTNVVNPGQQLVQVASIPEIEQKLLLLSQQLKKPVDPTEALFYTPAERRQLAKATRGIELGIQDYQAILDRVRHRVVDYLTSAERRLRAQLKGTNGVAGMGRQSTGGAAVNSREQSETASAVLSAERQTENAQLIATLDLLRNWFSKQSQATAAPPIDRRDFAFVQSAGHRAVLEKDYAEAQLAFSAGAYKAAGLLAGGVVETMLFDVLRRPDVVQRQDYAQAVQKLRRTSAGDIDWNKVSMTALIDATTTLGLLRSVPSRISGVARDIRDTVHPNAEVRLGFRANAEEAEILLVLVRLIYRDLST